jgi:hypothetical protein
MPNALQALLHSVQYRKGDFAVAAKRMLYVNYNPEALIRDEQSLMRARYEVDTVFGRDGVAACRSVAGYTFVLIDDACPWEERKELICWLTFNLPKLNILPSA